MTRPQAWPARWHAQRSATDSQPTHLNTRIGVVIWFADPPCTAAQNGGSGA